jgi:Leucine-rich repeat (LRR) protein
MIIIRFLDQNQFYGKLPDSFGNLRDLKNLDLSFNNLSGSIKVLASMGNLTNVWISNNQFTGNVCGFDNHSLTSL